MIILSAAENTTIGTRTTLKGTIMLVTSEEAWASTLTRTDEKGVWVLHADGSDNIHVPLIVTTIDETPANLPNIKDICRYFLKVDINRQPKWSINEAGNPESIDGWEIHEEPY